METCSICKKEMEYTQTDRIPIGTEEKPICPACKAQLTLLLHSSKLVELRGAIRYLTAHAETTADSDVAMVLRTLCEKTPPVYRERRTRFHMNRLRSRSRRASG